MVKTLFAILMALGLAVLGVSKLTAQGVAINLNGSSANASAMLDVQSTTSGMLIPRMTGAERGNIANPASGLLVYQTDAPAGFYFYNGTIWTRISAGIDASGTQNYISKFTGVNSLGNSQIFDNGTNVGIGTSSPGAKLDVSGNIKSTHLLQGTQLARPMAMWSASGTTIGAVIIKLPGTVANYGMLHMQIDVYEYGTEGVTTYIIGGHNWNSAWYNYNCHTIGNSPKKIRLAVKDGQYAIVIGEQGSSWSYGHVVMSKITNGGYYAGTMDLGGTYSISQDNSVESYTWISVDLNKTAVEGSGTQNYIAKFTSSTLLGNSIMYDNGTNVGIGTTGPQNLVQIHGASGMRISDPANVYRANLVFGNPGNNWNSGIRVYDNGDAELRIWHMNTLGQIVLATGYNGDQATTMPTDGLFIDQNKVGIGYASPAAATGKLLVNGNVGIGTTTPDVKLDVIGTTKSGAFAQNNNGLRITSPDGASYVTSTNSITGAIKITLPQYRTSTMMRMTVKIYQYITDQSYTIELGGYNYGSGGWYNTFANVTTTSGTALNVRFGYDGASKNCIWIGETASTWAYPQVFVTDFQAGYSNYTTDQWDDGWAVTFEPSFGTVETVANTSNSSGNSYINNGTASQSANFNISGYGYAGNYFQTPTLYVSGYRHTASTYENLYSDNNSSGGFHMYRNDGNSWGYFYADNAGIGILKDGSWAIRASGSVNATNTDVSFFTDGGSQRAYINSAGLYFTMSNPNINASSYFVAPGGAYFNSGTVYTEAQYQCRGGIHNDNAGDLTIAGGTNGTTYFSGPISGMSGNFPSNNMVRLTPNLHLNASAGYAVIANWDNGTTGTSQAFRIGNGASADAFYVRADSYTWAGTTSTSLANVIYASRPSGNYGGGRATIYGYRYGGGSGSDGSSYSVYGTDAGVQGYTYYGNLYAFGVAGHTYGDYNRTGGTMGSDNGGSSWGSLGYKNSGSTWYGLYYTSAGAGSGFMNNNGVLSGIGSGGYGGVMGGWSRGEVLGFTTAGELYASYNLGNEYTSGVSADIVTVNNERIPAYSVTSNEVKVYSDGVAVLQNGYCKVLFDQSFTSLISSGKKPTVTVTPMGESEGIYIVSIDKDGFIVKESHGGQSNVEFTWIAVGLRADANTLNKVPEAITDRNFDQNMKDVMFNENDKDNSAKSIWWDGNTLRFDKIPETSVAKPKEDPNMPRNNSGDDVNRLIEQNHQPQPENREWRPTPEQPVKNAEEIKENGNK